MKANKQASAAHIFILVMALLIFSGCSGTQPAGTGQAQGTLELTLQELSQYNGQNGRPAYVAVDGVIYDVTNLPKWKGGMHNMHNAGSDLTEEIKTKSPHGIVKLKSVPVVGRLK